MGEFNQKELGELTDNRSLIGDAVEHYRDLCDGKPAIVFCTNVMHAEHTANMFNEAGYQFRVLTGNLKKQEREQIIEDLSTGAINGITSVNCVSEGTDIPVVSVAILMRPTLSLAMSLQQMGRALRLHEDKKCAIILDHAGNTHRHGMPDTKREWSLDSPIKQTKKREAEDQESWRECPECFGYIPMSETVCPQCGAEYVKKEIKEIETIAGRLEMVVPEDFDEEIQNIERMNYLQSVGIGEMTGEQLREYGKLKGYKSVWAWMQLQRRK